MPGLSALFSACTSTDAYSVVSVRDFLCLCVEEEEESVEESGEVPGLSALFSACTSTDAYSAVSVRDFLCLFIWN